MPPIIDINKNYSKEQCDSINNQFNEFNMNDVAGRIIELEKCQTLNDEQHKTIMEKIVNGFCSLSEKMDEVIKHQKHTNGDVSSLKIWRAGVVGGLSVIMTIGGMLSTLYFIERADQKSKNETVIELKQQVTMINDKLKELQLVQ